jgi:oligopeptide transport system permease protein
MKRSTGHILIGKSANMKLPLIIVAIIAFAAIVLPPLLPWGNAAIDWDHVRAPLFSDSHWLGTDDLGRDRLARLLVGTRITLSVALAAALVAMVIGTIWGATAGWIGGRTDELMMRIVDGLYALPFMFVVILLMVVFGRSILLVFLGIGAVEWLTMARVVRGQVMLLKSRPFVLAAEAAGASGPVNLIRHILPNVAGVAIAYLLLTIPQVVMVESFLSFLGLGVQEPLTSIGILVNEGADEMDMVPAALLLPAAMLVTIIICLTIAGEKLRDHLADAAR